jgi:hypothetical protein
MLFIKEVLLGLQTNPSTFYFLFFFVNFNFFNFFVFLKASNINSTRKINDHKIYTLKVERFQIALKI